MTSKIQSDAGEHHPYRLHLAKALHRIIVDLDVKAGWLAFELGISETLLSDYRSGTKAIPAYRVLQVDELLGVSRLAETMAAISGHHLVTRSPSALSAGDLERIFPQILREEGAASADIVTALLDKDLDAAERETIHRHAAKLRRFWQEVEERTAPIQNLRRAE